MADKMIDEAEISTNPFNYRRRPVHMAFLNKKLPCPHIFCAQNVAFFEESGIEHHWRVIHNKKLNTDDMHNAHKFMRKIHGEETLRCLGELFCMRSTQVYEFLILKYLNCRCE